MLTLDPKSRVVTLEKGQKLTLRPISILLLARLQNEIEEAKPTIPVVEATVGGDTPHKEENPDDPTYRQAVRDWHINQSQRLMFYAFTAGIEDPVPPDDYAQIREYFPQATELEIKYYWIVGLLGDGEAVWAELVNLIMGQNQITQKGLEQSNDSFRSDGEPDPDPTGELEAVASEDHVQLEV